MQPSQKLQFLDASRWFIGLNPPWFLIEVVGRSTLIYVALQVVLRLMGRRMASQMTTSELAVVVTLGAAVGVPMQAPDRGMLAAGLILILALLFQRGLGRWTFHSQRMEQLTMGDVVTVVQDGRLLMDTLRKLVLSRERLFSILRASGVEHLGELRRVYVEVTGDFSIYKFKKPKPGLSVLPIFDNGWRDHFALVPGILSALIVVPVERIRKFRRSRARTVSARNGCSLWKRWIPTAESEPDFPGGMQKRVREDLFGTLV